MLVYILKSSACLVIFFLFYKSFLEKASMHTFKRLYLLAVLALSLIIPLLVFKEYVTRPIAPETETFSLITTREVSEIKPTPDPTFDLNTLMWFIYGLGLFLFGLKFIQNLVQIIGRIRNNPKKKYPHCTHVLHQEKIPPHTFFRFIFLNKYKLENNGIPHEVLVHEETHVAQKHSWDVIFVELLQVVLWFNPLIVFFKKAIKLNHEFLADQAVLSKNTDTANYQNILLAFSTTKNNKQFQPPLSNAIHYSSIKKRLTVMKTRTSQKSMVIRTLLLIPIATLLLFSFSNRKTVVRTQNELVTQSKVAPIKIKVNEKQEIFVEDKRVGLKKLSKEINKLTKSTDSQHYEEPQVHLIAQGHLDIELLTSIKKQLAKAGASLNAVIADTIIIDGEDMEEALKGIPFTVRDTLHIKSNDGKTILGTSTTPAQKGANPKQLKEYNALAKKYYELPLSDNLSTLKKGNTTPINLDNSTTRNELERVYYLYSLMSQNQKLEAEPFPFPEMEKWPPTDKVKEVHPLKTTYGDKAAVPQSSTKEISEVPSPIYTSDSIEISGSAEWPRVPMIAYRLDNGPVSQELKKLFDDYSRESKSYYDGVIRFVLHRQGNKEQLLREYNVVMALHKEYEKLATVEGVFARPEPGMAKMVWDRLPPHPQHLIDHAIGLAEKNAIYFYNNKEISTDEAMQLLRNNHELRIKSMLEKNNITEVRMFSSN